MTHHRHTPDTERDRCFSGCVVRREHSERTHGNIVCEQRCACGATRLIEVNGGATATDGWQRDDAE